MGKIGGAPPRRGSPTDKARWVHQEIQRTGWWECRFLGTRWVGKRSKGNPRNRHGEWALEERHGQSLST